MRLTGLVLALLWLPLGTVATSAGAQSVDKVARVAILSAAQRSPTGYLSSWTSCGPLAGSRGGTSSSRHG